MLINHGEAIAKKYYAMLKNNVLDMEDEVIFEASRFRRKYVKRHFSYVDCLGYAYAKLHKLKFLTGDNAFKGMDNVEFVK